MSCEHLARRVLALCGFFFSQKPAMREKVRVQEWLFCAGFSARIPQKLAYQRRKTRTSPQTHCIAICAVYSVLRTQNSQYFPQKSKITRSANPETHHKHMSNNLLNAGNSQLSNGANPISEVILLRECAAIYCSGVSYR
jgi:hypothetical protein